MQWFFLRYLLLIFFFTAFVLWIIGEAIYLFHTEFKELAQWCRNDVSCTSFVSKLSISDDPFDKPPCRGCSSYLTEPYIKCAECGPSPFLLCLQVSMWQMYKNIVGALVYFQSTQSDWYQTCFQCFTRGFEYKKHESDHRYEIMVSQTIFIFMP